MRRKLLFVVLLAALAALGALYAVQGVRMLTLGAKLQWSRARTAGPAGAVQEGVGAVLADAGSQDGGDGEDNSLRAQIMRAAHTMLGDEGGESGGEGDEAQDPREVMERMLGEVMKRVKDNPAFRRLIDSQLSNRVDKDYGPLFKRLGLADPSAFVDLLVQKYQLGLDLYFAMQEGDPTPEQHQKMMELFSEKEEEIDQQLRELLGEDGYEVYEEYNRTLPERQQVSGFKDKLYSAGLDLTAEQEESLIRMMYDARTAGINGFEDPELQDLSMRLPEERGLSAAEMQLRLTEYQFRKYLTEAEGVLSPQQLGVFGEYLNDLLYYTETLADFMPAPVQESNDRAPVQVGNRDEAMAGPVQIRAADVGHVTWSDMQSGSKAAAYKTDGNMLGFRADVGSGWGAGITLWPEAAAKNADDSVSVPGATRIVARVKAPRGTNLRFGLVESGADWPGASGYAGAGGADGEAFRHEGLVTADGWQVYTVPMSELKLNGGFGNQSGNRTIDTGGIKGIELLVPGGQPDCELEIDWVRLE